MDEVDTSKNPISPRLRSNQINNLALAEGASGEVFRTLQLGDEGCQWAMRTGDVIALRMPLVALPKTRRRKRE